MDNNVRFVMLGTSRQASNFVCDATVLAWEGLFRAMYTDAAELPLCGSAGTRRAPSFHN